MTRTTAIDTATEFVDDGRFLEDLTRRVAIRSCSQEPDLHDELHRYLDDELRSTLDRLGYSVEVMPNPVAGGGPFLVAERHEGDDLPTVLTYGHGDVVRGLDDKWADERSPWTVDRAGDRLYGRGTADNKGQHTINLLAIEAVLATRGRLGFNSRLLFETSEEIGSPGLREFCAAYADRLTSDVLIASDGPRQVPDEPTMFLGTRGAMNFELVVDLRDGAHHSGNWGGLLANPGIRLSHAIGCLVGEHGEIKVPELRPEEIPAAVRAAVAACRVDGGDDGPEIDTEWGEPGLEPIERLLAWNTLEVLSMVVGDPSKVVNAIPPTATAWCHIRFTVDRDPSTFLPAIRRHLDEHGFDDVEVRQSENTVMEATRLSPDHPWVQWAAASIEATVGRPPMIAPNLGGSLPNDVFTSTLSTPTVWVPHSYGSCSQHAPDEHLLLPIVREGAAVMAGLFWDLGEPGTPPAG